MSDYRYLKIVKEAGAVTVTIDRPEKRNALAPEVLEELAAVFESITSDQEVRVAVLTGGERYFSAGFDLNYLKTVRIEDNGPFTDLFHRAYRAILFCPAPVLAAVGGPAIAGGFDLALMCDVRYASKRAKFGQREVTLSLNPIVDPLWRIVGLGRAKELAYTGRIYGAEEAREMGLVNAVFADGELLENVGKIAREMASCDRRTLRETKTLAHVACGLDLDGAMKAQEWLFRQFLGTDESRGRIEDLLARLGKK